MNFVAITPSAACENRVATLRRWLVWTAAAALAAPAALVLHELGHFLAAKLFGFPDVVLHYASVSDSSTETGFPLWQQGVRAAAGPVVTLAVVLACCVAVARRGPHALALGAAFGAGIRSVVIGGAYVLMQLTHPGRGATSMN